MYKYNKNFFEKIDSPKKAYWLGFLYADGCVFNQRKSKILEISLSKKDKNHKEHYLAASAGYKEYGEYNISAFY